VAACMDVGSACTENRACCSYGCVQGFCMANPENGGQCRTSDDCADGACRNGRCDQSAVCRDASDRCDWDGQCCTETCNAAGTCVQNGAPTVVATSNANPEGKLATGTAIVFDARGSSDPDGDGLSYGWQVIRVPSLTPVACANGSASATCTISLPQLGAYRAVVTVTDGKVDPAPQGTLDVEVVNLPPIVQAMTISDQTPSRNVSFTVSASVVDPDGDPLTCSWTSTAPGGTPQPIAGATSCSSLSFTGGAEGTWAFTIHPDDGVDANAPASRTVAVTVINDAPVVTAAANVYGNMQSASPITLSAAANDRNGDTVTYQWSLMDGAGDLTNPNAATTEFVPPAEGTYVLTVTATDPAAFGRPAATSAPMTVTVHVAQPVLPLPGVLRDAELVRTATGDLVVAVGADPADATKGKLWVINAADGTVVREASLATVATSVSTNADATLVAVGATAAFYWIDFRINPVSVNQGNEPFAIGDVVLAGGKRIFLFPQTATSSAYIYAFDVTSPATVPASTSRTGHRGRLTADGNWLLALDGYWTDVSKYSVATSGQASNALGYVGYASYATYGCTPANLWITSSGSEAFTSCGDVYTIATMVHRPDLSLGGSVVHADTTASGVVVSRGGTLVRFDTNFQQTGSDVVPVWGWDGRHHVTTADFVFSGSDGTRYAVVSAGAGISGLVSFAP
jgi:hypothetical protein